MEKKTYLMPRIFRRGNPVITAVVKSGGSSGTNYFLVTWHNLDTEVVGTGAYRGEGRDYLACSRVKISSVLYKAFLAEAKTNHKRFMPVKMVHQSRSRLRQFIEPK